MFDIPRLFQDGKPDDATLTTSLFIYKQAFSGSYMYNRAAAASMIMFVIIAILASLMFFVMRDKDEAQLNKQIRQQHAISLIPSSYMMNNIKILLGKSFNPAVGFANSLIISIGATALAIYFSSLTAYAQVAYNWKLRNVFFSFIMVVMMIPAQVTMIGFYQMVYKIHMTNKLSMLILPAIASPTMRYP